MKKGKKLLLLCAVLVIGMLSSIHCLPRYINPYVLQGNRSWRLDEMFKEINIQNEWVSTALANNYYATPTCCVPDSTISSYFDDVQGWVPGNSDVYIYNPGGQCMAEILSHYIMLGDYVPSMRGIFQYDNDNRITEAIIQTSGLDRNWFDYKRMYITYDNGYISQIITCDLSDYQNPPSYTKSDFSWDPQYRISLQMDYFSGDSLEWYFDYRTNISYHGSDTSNGLSQVEELSRELPYCLYFEQPIVLGLVSERVGQMWMYQYWRDDFREVFTYDNYNRLTSYTTMENTMMGEWLNLNSYNYEYDNNGNTSTDLYQNWNEDNNSWEDFERISYTWEQTTPVDDDIIPSVSDLQMEVYPNPFRYNCEISIRSKSQLPVKLEIYNCKGQKIHSEITRANVEKVISGELISGKMKASGVYLVNAKQGQNQAVTKILKLK